MLGQGLKLWLSQTKHCSPTSEKEFRIGEVNMDVNLDEMTEEICERIADLKIKKIRIRERLKTIETKSEA